MPPRAARASTTRPERRALQDTLAWPIVAALLAGAVVVFFLPRVVPTPFLALAVGGVFAIVTALLVAVLAIVVERWLRRHATTLAADAERQVQLVGVAGLPTATGDGALIPMASAFADAGARAALQAAERESSETLARLGADVADTLDRIRERSHVDATAARRELDEAGRALRRVLAPVQSPLAPIDAVAVIRDAIDAAAPGSVQAVLETDRAMVSIDREHLAANVEALLALARAATPAGVPVTVHVSRILRAQIEDTPVRRTGDSRLTIVPRNSGDALRAWVLRAQPGAEVLSLIISDGGAAPLGDDAPRAFDPFAVARPGDPLGVVLATVRRTVVASRGTIWLAGSREGGTAVHLLLPIQSR